MVIIVLLQLPKLNPCTHKALQILLNCKWIALELTYMCWYNWTYVMHGYM